MHRAALIEILGDALASVVEERLASGRDVGEILIALRDEGRLEEPRLMACLEALEATITLSEAPPGKPGDYRVAGLLGEGAMGVVHIARDEALGRNVAVKRMFPHIADHPVLSGRFRAEAQITAQLDHPGIVPVHTLSIDDEGNPQYAMKLIRGKTLTRLLDETRARYEAGDLDAAHDLPARLEVFLQVCNAVAYAHSRGVIHRDLKPDNIMVGAFGEVLVMDWGIAKVLGAPDGLGGVVVSGGGGTEVGTVIGTAPYCSPEQAQGRNDALDPRSDQVALGLILYEVVCLKRAITGRTGYLVLLRAAEGDKDPIAHAYGEPVPPELRAVIDKATALDPDDRYPSVEAMAADVRRYLRDEEVEAAPDRGLQRAQRWVSHHRRATLAVGAALAASLVVVVLLAIVGGLVAYEVSRREAARREQRLADALAVAERRASAIDAELMRQEAIVAGIAGAAAEALVRPPPDVPVYPADAFDRGEVPDLLDSAWYEGRISLEHPDLFVPRGVSVEEALPRLRQLASLAPALRAALIDTESFALLDTPRTARTIVDAGLLGTWTYVATEDGFLAGYPGIGGYPDGYDPRERPWYRVGRAGTGPQWSAVAVDETDLGLLLTCTLRVDGRDGQPLGVAALDLDFSRFIDRFLEPDLDDPTAESWLVDGAGRVTVRGAQAAIARTLDAYEPEPFPYPEVLAAMQARPTGHAVVEIGGAPRLFTWAPLDAVDWTYVIEVDARRWMAR